MSKYFSSVVRILQTVVSAILFARFPTVDFNDVRRKLYMVGIQLTVGKRAKRMPDTTVQTTNRVLIEQVFC